MVNEIKKQKFINQLNKAFDYANKNGLSYGIFAWVGDAFKDADKEPFDKTNTPWHIKNTKFFVKTACFDDEDMIDKLTFFILYVRRIGFGFDYLLEQVHSGQCNKSAAKLIANLVRDNIKQGCVHKKTKSKTKEK